MCCRPDGTTNDVDLASDYGTWDIILSPMLESVQNSGLELLIRRTPYQSGLRCQAVAAKASHEKLEFRAMGFEEKKCIYICVAAITTKNLNIDFKKLKIPDAERERVCVCERERERERMKQPCNLHTTQFSINASLCFVPQGWLVGIVRKNANQNKNKKPHSKESFSHPHLS